MGEAIEAAGAKLRYLPAYSPDLNTIENLYAKGHQVGPTQGSSTNRIRALKACRPKPEGDCAIQVRGLLQTRRLSRLIDIKWTML